MERCRKCFECNSKNSFIRRFKEIEEKVNFSPILLTKKEIEFYHENKKKFHSYIKKSSKY